MEFKIEDKQLETIIMNLNELELKKGINNIMGVAQIVQILNTLQPIAKEGEEDGRVTSTER